LIHKKKYLSALATKDVVLSTL